MKSETNDHPSPIREDDPLGRVFENANDLPPDPDVREEKFPIPWYLRISIGDGGGEIGNL